MFRPVAAGLVALAAVVVWPAAPARAERPAFQVALGLGASLDDNAPNPKPDDPIPSFFFTGGFGAGLLGVDLRLFANGATAVQVTRLAGELALVIRPFAPRFGDARSYGVRVLRSLGADLGPAYERVSLGLRTSRRLGLLTGAHVDLPFGPPSAKELRLRLGGRRMWGGDAMLDTIKVEDSALELYAQLALVF